MSTEKPVSDEPTIGLGWAMLLLVPCAACTLGIAALGLWCLYGATGIPEDSQIVVIPTLVISAMLTFQLWRLLLLRLPKSPWFT